GVASVIGGLRELDPGLRQHPRGVGSASTSRDQPLDGPGHGNVPVPGLDAERGRRERLLPASSIEQAPGEKSVERPAGNPRIELLAKLPRLAGDRIDQLVLTQGRGDEYEVDVGSNRLDGQPRLSGMT